MRKIMSLLLSASLATSGFADQQQGYNQGEAQAQQFLNTVNVNGFNAENYTTNGINVDQQKSYKDNTDALTTDSYAVMSNDESVSSATEMYVNQDTEFSEDTPTMKMLLAVQDNSYEITHNISNEVFDCENGAYCRTVFEEKTCQKSNKVDFSCKQIPKITFKKKYGPARQQTLNTKNSMTGNFSGRIVVGNNIYIESVFLIFSSGVYMDRSLAYFAYNNLSNDRQYAFTDMDLSVFHVNINVQKETTGKNFEFGVQGYRINSYPGSYYGANLQPFYFTDLSQWAGAVYTPTSGSTYPYFSGDVYVRLTSRSISYEPIVEWVSNCENLSKYSCTETKICSSGRATKKVDGHNVTLDCWEYDLTYNCGKSDIDTCSQYQYDCDLLSTVCSDKEDGYCFQYQRQYSCPVRKCEEESIQCLDPSFCIDGDCVDDTREEAPVENFLESTSKLAATMEAAKDVDDDDDPFDIFTGQGMSCSDDFTGQLYSCCSEDLDDSALHKCSSQEQQIVEAKKQKRAIEVGRYCSNKVLWVCTAWATGFCVFDNKLARIVQQYGRPQLGMGFGSGESPDCRGLTVEEIQEVDLHEVDFSDFYEDVQESSAFPDVESLKSRMLKDYEDMELPQ